MKNTVRGLILSVALVTVLSGPSAQAQQSNVGNITGTVHDSSGAAVPDAQVAATNQTTTLTQSTVTSNDGLYNISRLPVGIYTVTVTKTGFQKEERTGVPIIAGQTFSVDLVLQVGSVTQTVTVTSATPVINSTDTNQGTTRTQAEIQDLPITLEGNAARAAVSVVQTLSGVNYNAQQSGGQSWTIISRAQINGVQPGVAGYEIDGVEASSGESESGVDFIAPVPEQVTEVRITGNTDASQGFNAGITYSLTTRSGTNNLHGDLYYYNRNDALEARNFFTSSVAPDKQNEVGFTLGGPVYIPKVYDGRNKTFFFFSTDIYRFITGTTAAGVSVATVPTAAERNGDFSALLGSQVGTDGLGRPVFKGEIYDPATTRPDGNGSFLRDPFAFNGQLNVIDPAKFSSVSKFFQPGYANPTGPGIVNNWVGLPNEGSTQKDQWSLKLDQLIGQKHRITFSIEKQFAFLLPRGTGQTGHSQVGGGSGYLSPLLTDQFIDDRGEYRYRFSYVWSMKPNALLSFRTGITRDPNRNISRLPLTGPAVTGGCDAGLKGTLDCRTPLVSIENTAGFGFIFEGYHTGFQRTPVTLDLAWTRGKHQYEFGVNYIAQPDAYANHPLPFGSFSFSHLETGLPEMNSATGWGYASFLLGQVDNGSVTSSVDGRWSTAAGAIYAQDKWRATSKLTINYGLRWELYIPNHELQNKISSFDPSKPNPGAGNLLGALSIYGFGPGRNGLTSLSNYYFKAFAPKLGVAYSYDSKTVLRASAGISYYPYLTKWLSSTGPTTPADGFNQTQSFISHDSGVTPAFAWDNGFPGVFPKFPIVDPSLDNGFGITYLDRNDYRPPMVENFGAEIERELPSHVALRVGYVGTMAHRYYGAYNMDALPLKYLALGSLLSNSVTSPAAVAAGITVPYAGFSGTVAQALTPYPQYTSVTNLAAQTGNSTYNSLQINVQRHFGSLTFLGNVTLSKFLDNSDTPGYGNNYASLKTQSPEIRKTAKSLAGALGAQVGVDTPKQAALSWYWDVPVGKGKRYLTNASALTDRILGNWRLSGIQHYAAGSPIAVTTNESIPSLGGVWPVLVNGSAIKKSGGCASVHPGVPGQSAYLNAAAFADPAPFTLGNVSVLSTVRACGYLDEDLGIDKEIPIRETKRIAIGALASNLFNRHQLININSNIDSPAFGTFSGASFPRSIQLYVRIEF